MSFVDLRAFLAHLEACGQLARIKEPVDADQQVNVIHHRVIARGGPALLFEKVKGADFRLVTNLMGTARRVRMVLGQEPAAIGEQLARLAQDLMPPGPKALWRARRPLLRLARSRLRTVSSGPVTEREHLQPDLRRLPVLTCWPEDGGAFFTLPLVHTQDPETGQGNLGIYRMQRFGADATGMHWQIEKGGGFHFFKACRAGRSLPVSVVLGGPPALIVAAVAPLPETVDERLLAAWIMGRPLDLVRRPDTGHRIPARAEMVLEGTVSPGDVRLEGPFGDHFGHYSHAAEFPVFRLRRMLARSDAIFPATVVGKPVQEDYFIGEALQQITLPLLRLMRPAVTDFWAYPQTGFHPLAVAAVRERYRHEALKCALGLLGEGQVSLTKVMITVDGEVPAADIHAVSRAVWRHLDADGLHLLAPTAQDTLDFTGPAMNTGSRLILVANGGGRPPVRSGHPPRVPSAGDFPAGVHSMAALGPAFLLVQVDGSLGDPEPLFRHLAAHPEAGRFVFHVLVSDDVPIDDPILALWGWFTRFDPCADLYPAGRRVTGNRLLLDFPIGIDARWKSGYPKPVAFDPQVAETVDRQWHRYGIRL